MKKVVRIFNSFEEENAAKQKRRAEMTIQERLNEFGVLQARVWGKSWTDTPMIKTAVCEELPWRKHK